MRWRGPVEWCYPFTSTIFGGLLNDGLLFGVAEDGGVGRRGQGMSEDEKKLMYVNREKIVWS